MSPPQDSAYRKIAANRRALHDYAVLERFEAGIQLCGTEVKSVRAGEVSLPGSFASVENGNITLHHLKISTYEHGNRFNHEPTRPRRLLLHRKEITKLQVQTDQKGFALIPLSVYIKKGHVKVELGLCKGKQQQDKRETLKRKTAERETQRAIAAARRTR
jgi:SsrA-binding protein